MKNEKGNYTVEDSNSKSRGLPSSQCPIEDENEIFGKVQD